MGDKIVTIGGCATLDVDEFVEGIRSTTRSTTQNMVVSGAVTPGVNAIELNHKTVAVAATIADLSEHQGLLVIKDTSASGTAAHTVTVTTGTLDGANKIATLNAAKECLVLWIDSAGNGTVVENVGEVGLS